MGSGQSCLARDSEHGTSLQKSRVADSVHSRDMHECSTTDGDSEQEGRMQDDVTEHELVEAENAVVSERAQQRRQSLEAMDQEQARRVSEHGTALRKSPVADVVSNRDMDTIDLDVTDVSALGISHKHANVGKRQVKEVLRVSQGSFMQRWNLEHPERAVMPGDIILTANGQCVKDGTSIVSYAKNGRLQLKIKKCTAHLAKRTTDAPGSTQKEDCTVM